MGDRTGVQDRLFYEFDLKTMVPTPFHGQRIFCDNAPTEVFKRIGDEPPATSVRTSGSCRSQTGRPARPAQPAEDRSDLGPSNSSAS